MSIWFHRCANNSFEYIKNISNFDVVSTNVSIKVTSNSFHDIFHKLHIMNRSKLDILDVLVLTEIFLMP